MKRFTSLQAKLPLLMVGVVVVPLLFFAVFGYTQIQTYFIQQKLGDMMNIIDVKYVHMLDYLDRSKAEITSLAENPTIVASLDPASQEGGVGTVASRFLNKTVESNKFTQEHATGKDVPTRNRFASLMVIDNGGTIVAASNAKLVGTKAHDHMNYSTAEAGVIDVHIDESGDSVFGFSAPVEVGGSQAGHMIAMVDTALLGMIMTGEIGNVTGGELYFSGYSDNLDFYIMNKDGLMISQSRVQSKNTVLKTEGSKPPLERTHDTEAEGMRMTSAGLETGAHEVMEVYTDYKGDRVAGATMTVSEVMCTMGMEEDVQMDVAPT